MHTSSANNSLVKPPAFCGSPPPLFFGHHIVRTTQWPQRSGDGRLLLLGVGPRSLHFLPNQRSNKLADGSVTAPIHEVLMHLFRH